MSDVTIKHLQAFVAVVDLGTFRRAAERLNTTQPNISGRIAQLEGRLGVTLMERDAGSVRLTARGAPLLEAARRVLDALDGFVAAAEDDALFDDTLRLGVSELVAHTWLRAFLLAMRERFASVHVELTVDLSENLSRALFERELDLVFQNGPFERRADGTAALGRARYVWVAAPETALPARTLSAEALATQPILTHARGSAPWRELDAHFRGVGQRARLVPSSNIATCLQMTLDGLGVACLPEAMLAVPLADGRLRCLDYPWRPDDLAFAARHVVDPAPTVLREAVSIARTLFPPVELLCG